MRQITDGAEPQADWERLRPVLDATMQCFNDRERATLLLRFFDRRPLAEVGATLGISENAAQKTVERALGKLRSLLARHGVSSTSSALALVLSEQTVIAAPANITMTVAAAAITNAGATTGFTGVLATLLAMSKLKTAIIGAAVLGLLSATFVEVRANRALRSELRGLQGGDAAFAGEQRIHQVLTRSIAGSSPGNAEVTELAQVEDRIAQLAGRPPGVVDSAMRPVANVGRATPEAAFVSLCAAINAGDLNGVAALISFRNDSPESREAFWTSFPATLRARYETPEKLAAAAARRKRRHVLTID